MRTEHKSERDDWLTPVDILERAQLWMGSIFLDPCADVGGHVPARRHYTKEDDGLAQPWCGNVFMNPPYNRHQDQRKFVVKFLEEWIAGRVGRATLLLAARTDTAWHRLLNPFPRCYVYGRLKFLNPVTHKEIGPAPFPSVVFAASSRPEDYDEFYACFRQIGGVFRLYA